MFGYLFFNNKKYFKVKNKLIKLLNIYLTLMEFLFFHKQNSIL